MQTGVSMPSPRSRLTTLTPSSPGIITSSTITAGGRCATAARASRPSAAVDTAKPSRRSARSRACLTVASSSTTRTSGSLRTTPPMMRLRPDGGLDLRLRDAELGGELGDERLALGLVLLLERRADLLDRGLQLRRGHAERLGERGAVGAGAAGVAGAAEAAGPAGAAGVAGAAGTPGRAGTQAVERGA